MLRWQLWPYSQSLSLYYSLRMLSPSCYHADPLPCSYSCCYSATCKKNWWLVQNKLYNSSFSCNRQVSAVISFHKTCVGYSNLQLYWQYPFSSENLICEHFDSYNPGSWNLISCFLAKPCEFKQSVQGASLLINILYLLHLNIAIRAAICWPKLRWRLSDASCILIFWNVLLKSIVI